MSLEDDQHETIRFLREKLSEQEKEISFLKQLISQSNQRTDEALRLQKAALERVLSEVKVSTDRAFYEHITTKVEKILSGEHHSVLRLAEEGVTTSVSLEVATPALLGIKS